MVAAATYTATEVLIEGFAKTGGKGGAALRDAIAAENMTPQLANSLLTICTK